MTSATDALRALLDERGVEWTSGLPTETIVSEPIDALYVERPDGRMHVYFRSYLTPEQAVEATLGRAYEPPVAMHWDGDVLVLTTPRDPSSIHVQRAEGQPRKVYPAEATLGRGTCQMTVMVTGSYATYEHYEYIMHCENCHFEFGLVKYNEDGDTWQDEKPNYCPNCGRKVVG